ncbi:cytochrome P450 6k1-like [Odontomachus brunneus]|uniref:cytochrome P450 6k1-like n=1 Tax=Odontomachus brunneus TaxID=486640 RepID=UPI0013F1AAB0|nr:cytochrome P450 6k1-like [Odontomachus brunneus]XP_032678362.1 cytochrome P450 6k1-like [Odontomachus brunneus]XP_032678363.1 cytochrome P450 6k1-like [Odontomachus brunneus]
MALVTSYWVLDGMILLTAVIVAAYLYMTRNFKYWKKRGVLEITPVPFVGNFTECMLMQKNPGYFMKDLYEYGKGTPYIGFYVFDTPCLLVRDRELVKNVLVKDFNYFYDRHGTPDTNDRLGYANLFFIRNPAWKVLRTKLTPVFTSGKLKKMFELMLECADNLDIYINSLGLEDNSKTLDVKELIAKFTTDVIGSTAYGLNVNSLNNPDAEFRKHGKKIFQYDFVRSFEILAVFFLPTIVRLAGIHMFGKESSNFLRKAFWETMLQRMQSGQKRNDLIDALIELKKTHSDQNLEGFKFDGDDLVAQAAVFFAAGFETSSTVTAFTLYELAIHPEIQTRLRKEIVNALKESNGDISYDMTMSLPYLDMVVSETLRKYPTLPFLDRRTMDTYKVPNSDLVIEKGTPIYISMLGMHYDPEYFPDPEKYDPERFNEKNKRNIPGGVYFPFGEGPRSCIGTRFGLLTTKLALIKIFSKCEVIPSEKTMIPMILDPKAAFASPLGGKIQLNIQKVSAN